MLWKEVTSPHQLYFWKGWWYLGKPRRHFLSEATQTTWLSYSCSSEKQSQSHNYLNCCLFQNAEIIIYHAEIWAAHHQALRGLPEDWALLCSCESQAGGPRPYPFEQCLGHGCLCSVEKLRKVGMLWRPGRMLRGFILKPGGGT